MRHDRTALAVLLSAGVLVCSCSDDGTTPAASDDTGPGAQDAALDTVADAAVGDAGVDDTTTDAVSDAVEPQPSTLDFDVDGPGPYGVGYRTWDIEYLVPPDDAPRTITVNAWYPTDATEGEHPRYVGVFPDPVSLIDAPAADPVDGVAYPVVVHSHGHQAFGGGSAFIMRRMASHGWVAIAPDHEGNTFFDNSRGGLARHFIERPMDIIASLDAVEALDDSDPLARADTSHVLMTGHSRGTYTVWAVCGADADEAGVRSDQPDATEAEVARFVEGFDDPRVVACVPLAGSYRRGWFGDTGYEAVDEPVLSLSGSADNPDAMRSMFDLLTEAELTWVELEGGCHETFGLNACDVLPPEQSEIPVGTWVLAFGRHHVLGDEGDATMSILDGSRPVADFVTVMTR